MSKILNDVLPLTNDELYLKVSANLRLVKQYVPCLMSFFEATESTISDLELLQSVSVMNSTAMMCS